VFSDKELFAQLDQTLKTLPGKLQRAFILAEFEQMPYEENGPHKYECAHFYLTEAACEPILATMSPLIFKL
jgi:hypothetical protein